MKNVIILITGLLLTACGPNIALLKVDVKQPAAYPVHFTDKQIAIFNILDDSVLSPETEAQFQLDSLLVNQFSEGFRYKLEASLSLPPESIAIYNLYYNEGLRGNLSDTVYLQQLALETGANSLVLVDSLRFGDAFFLNAKGRASMGLSSYITSYAAVACQKVLRVFDVDKNKFVAYFPGKDTVYWEFLHKTEVRDASQLLLQQQDYYYCLAARDIGEDYAQGMQAQWQTQERVLFYYAHNGKWRDATEEAFLFNWEKARQIWMGMAGKKAGNKASAYAAYNVAVCCEMMGQHDMAKEWLDAAQKRWHIPEIKQYRAILNESKQTQRYILLQQTL